MTAKNEYVNVECERERTYSAKDAIEWGARPGERQKGMKEGHTLFEICSQAQKTHSLAISAQMHLYVFYERQ